MNTAPSAPEGSALEIYRKIASPSATVAMGELTINRLGFGAMQLTGDGVWGYPPDPVDAKRLLRRAVELGVNFIDTADSYGPHVSEEIICEALAPYRGIVIATKGGLLRTGPHEWIPLGKPEYLRQQAEMSLRRLRVECIDLYQLHCIDPKVPIEESLAELVRLQQEGKIREIGVSGVTLAELKQARLITDIASVQNPYSLKLRDYDDVLSYCETESVAFIAYSCMAGGNLLNDARLMEALGNGKRYTPAQLCLSWLLTRSLSAVPIPGTRSVIHLEENCRAASIILNQEEFDRVSAIKWS